MTARALELAALDGFRHVRNSQSDHISVAHATSKAVLWMEDDRDVIPVLCSTQRRLVHSQVGGAGSGSNFSPFPVSHVRLRDVSVSLPFICAD